MWYNKHTLTLEVLWYFMKYCFLFQSRENCHSITLTLKDTMKKYCPLGDAIIVPACGLAPFIHWGRVTDTRISKLTIIGSDIGLSPGRRKAIIWTNAVILLIGPLWTNFSKIWIRIQTFSFKKMHLNMSSGKCRPFCLGLNVSSVGMSAG